MNHARRPVDVVETHISTLFFTPERVYKLLKPIRTGFLDHSTVARRAAAMDAEFELNRRLAADVYLGLVDLTEDSELADRMLIMRRLPDDRRLAALAGSPSFLDELRRVAHAVATFHAALPPIYGEVPLATADGVRRFWESSFSDIEQSVGTVIDGGEFATVRQLARNYLEHHAQLFAQRQAAGFVRDGHGDLIADDIFMLDDGPRILDCLAFDAAYRTSDVLADIAFLVMDVEHFAGATAGDRLMRWYCEMSNEHHPRSLADHYVAYRAHVRAKVAVIRFAQGDEPSLALARGYHAQTLAHLQRARSTLMLVGGGPGTGKSTLAEGLAGALEWAVVDSDALRKDLYHVEHGDHAVDAHPGLYSDTATDATYRALLRQAAVLLAAGESVIADATWPTSDVRALATDVARRAGARLVEVECVLDADLARQRISARHGMDASDATPGLVDQHAGRRDPWPSARRISTKADPATVVDEVAAMLAGV